MVISYIISLMLTWCLVLEANPDAEYYTWTRVDNFDAATKQKITEYWCNEDELLGKPIADSKVFK